MDELKARARRTYELARAGLAARWVAGMLPLAVLLCFDGSPWAALLPAVVGVMAFWGRAPGRSLWPGVLAGSIALSAPLLGRFTGLLALGCGPTEGCVAACTAAGLVAGVMLAVVARGPVLLWAVALAAGMAGAASLPLGLGVAAVSALSLAATVPLARVAVAAVAQ
jgi:hypothetical protein